MPYLPGRLPLYIICGVFRNSSFLCVYTDGTLSMCCMFGIVWVLLGMWLYYFYCVMLR